MLLLYASQNFSKNQANLGTFFELLTILEKKSFFRFFTFHK